MDIGRGMREVLPSESSQGVRKMTATEARNQTSVLRAIQKHAGRAISGRHHFTVVDQMDAIMRLAEHGVKSIDIDTKVIRDSSLHVSANVLMCLVKKI